MSAIDYKKMYEAEQARYARCKDENEQIRYKNTYLVEVLAENSKERCELFQENERLKQAVAEREEALRKCSPCTISNEYDTYCSFCGFINETHTDDCEYIRLCGDSK